MEYEEEQVRMRIYDAAKAIKDIVLSLGSSKWEAVVWGTAVATHAGVIKRLNDGNPCWCACCETQISSSKETRQFAVIVMDEVFSEDYRTSHETFNSFTCPICLECSEMPKNQMADLVIKGFAKDGGYDTPEPPKERK